MTKVEKVEKDIKELEGELGKLEDRVGWIEYEIDELEGEQQEGYELIEANKVELKELYKKLELYKVDNEPIEGQLMFINTGYKEAVLI